MTFAVAPPGFQIAPPEILEKLSFEEILDGKIERLLALDSSLADSLALESEPLSKLLESDSYDELTLRQRVNDALRSNLLTFAQGSDLDHLASFYDITRLALPLAVPDGIHGWTTARAQAVWSGGDPMGSLDEVLGPPVDARDENRHGAAAIVPDGGSVSLSRQTLRRYIRLGFEWDWIGVRWPEIPWKDIDAIVGVHHGSTG